MLEKLHIGQLSRMGMSDTEPRTFSCKKCGHPFVARPPYEGYDNPLAKPCQIKDHDSPQLYECEECDHRNVLYWCSDK
jgi:hypothetical protein